MGNEVCKFLRQPFYSLYMIGEYVRQFETYTILALYASREDAIVEQQCQRARCDIFRKYGKDGNSLSSSASVTSFSSPAPWDFETDSDNENADAYKRYQMGVGRLVKEFMDMRGANDEMSEDEAKDLAIFTLIALSEREDCASIANKIEHLFSVKISRRLEKTTESSLQVQGAERSFENIASALLPSINIEDLNHAVSGKMLLDQETLKMDHMIQVGDKNTEAMLRAAPSVQSMMYEHHTQPSNGGMGRGGGSTTSEVLSCKEIAVKKAKKNASESVLIETRS